MLVRKEEAPWGGCFCLRFPGAGVVQYGWRMLGSRDWVFWCERRMLGSRDQVFGVSRGC